MILDYYQPNPHKIHRLPKIQRESKTVHEPKHTSQRLDNYSSPGKEKSLRTFASTDKNNAADNQKSSKAALVQLINRIQHSKDKYINLPLKSMHQTN